MCNIFSPFERSKIHFNFQWTLVQWFKCFQCAKTSIKHFFQIILIILAINIEKMNGNLCEYILLLSICQIPEVFVYLWSQGIGWIRIKLIFAALSVKAITENQPDFRRAICKSNQEAASPPQRFQGWRIWFGSYQAFTMIPTFLEEESHVMVSILKEKNFRPLLWFPHSQRGRARWWFQ